MSTWVLRARGGRESVGLVRAMGGTVAALVGLVVVGTAGYALVEGWSLVDSLYMTVITVTTIGFGEVRPLSEAGRAFTIVYILLGVVIASRAVADVARYVAEGRLAEDVRTRRARRELSRMHQHFIVVGYGRLGKEIVADLLHHGADVVVIDKEEADLLPPGVRLIVGDATLDETLLEARVDRARGLAVATPFDPVNVYITLTARQMNAQLFIHTRAEEDAAAAKARRAGANSVIMPYQIGGARMAQAMLRPGASAFVEHVTHRHFDDMHLEDVLVGGGPTALTGSLRELGLRARHGVSVVAIQRAGESGLIYPDPDTVVAPGDTLVVVGEPERVRAFRQEAGP